MVCCGCEYWYVHRGIELGGECTHRVHNVKHGSKGHGAFEQNTAQRAVQGVPEAIIALSCMSAHTRISHAFHDHS
jgi:hypothetical protein